MSPLKPSARHCNEGAKFLELLERELRETIHPAEPQDIEAEINDLGLGEPLSALFGKIRLMMTFVAATKVLRRDACHHSLPPSQALRPVKIPSPP